MRCCRMQYTVDALSAIRRSNLANQLSMFPSFKLSLNFVKVKVIPYLLNGEATSFSAFNCISGVNLGSCVYQISWTPFYESFRKNYLSRKIFEWLFSQFIISFIPPSTFQSLLRICPLYIYPAKFLHKSVYFCSHRFPKCSNVISLYIIQYNNILRNPQDPTTPQRPSQPPTFSASKSGGHDTSTSQDWRL